MKINIFNKIFIIRNPFKFYKLESEKQGVVSRTDDNYHVFFLDIDDIELEKLIVLLKEVQSIFSLSEFYIFQSREINTRGYHVYCLDKLTKGHIIDIHEEFFFKEEHLHDYFSLKRGYWVLRFSEKRGFIPKFILTIKSNNVDYEKSNAHRLFLKKIYNIDIEKTNEFDSLVKTGVHYYKTISKSV